MTSKPITLTKTKKKRIRFPDFEPRADMQNWLYLYDHSFPVALKDYLGEQETTITGCEIPVSPSVEVGRNVRIPDLLVSRNSNPALLIEQNGYAIDSQGKPPDFVLEVASYSTGVNDYTVKRRDYERYGIQEYWRFDPSGGQRHDAALAGDRLVDGRYEPIEIEWLDDNRCRGYSDALGLYLCWEHGELFWYDPVAGDYLQTYEEEVARADRESERADRAEDRADLEAERANRESERADHEAARAARAEAELQRLRQQLADADN